MDSINYALLCIIISMLIILVLVLTRELYKLKKEPKAPKYELCNGNIYTVEGQILSKLDVIDILNN